jgi:ABC-type dipeptide/oligopeptide/nickel transport system permease component
VGWATHLVLAWITVSLVYVALYTRMTRSSMLEVAGEDYIRTARAKGLSERRVVRRHLVRSSVMPVVTMLGLDLGGLLGGVIVVERMFGLPGLGAATVQAIGDNDLPMVQGVVLFAAFFVITANLLVDIAYAALDPRGSAAAEGGTASDVLSIRCADRTEPPMKTKVHARRTVPHRQAFGPHSTSQAGCGYPERLRNRT